MSSKKTYHAIIDKEKQLVCTISVPNSPVNGVPALFDDAQDANRVMYNSSMYKHCEVREVVVEITYA